MAKSCTTFDHTADVGLEAHAGSLPELYEALAEGLARVICPASATAAERETRHLEVTAADREALVVDFLWEVMTLVLHERFLVGRAAVALDGTPPRLQAQLRGERLDPGRHEIACEVKAVTYHGLRVAEDAGGGWTGRVILDL